MSSTEPSSCSASKAPRASGKRAERTAGNGLVVAADGAMIELNCETDFVAKNDQFLALAEQIASLAASTAPSDREALPRQHSPTAVPCRSRSTHWQR